MFPIISYLYRYAPLLRYSIYVPFSDVVTFIVLIVKEVLLVFVISCILFYLRYIEWVMQALCNNVLRLLLTHSIINTCVLCFLHRGEYIKK
jgi:hypothetical protein